ncbi:MAG TPA: STAS domain-containing protein [Thermoanaerobaculaceae bacterium]|nr:STAS domain-containing protein [Thermoanaerobaculaceae bacterium]
METFELRLAEANGDVAVLEVTGYINNEGGEAIAREAGRLLESGTRTLLFDLHATRIINSIGISLLLEVLERTLDLGGVLAFCCLSPSIAKTFQIMGLAQYARLFPDRAIALQELRPTP